MTYHVRYIYSALCKHISENTDQDTEYALDVQFVYSLSTNSSLTVYFLLTWAPGFHGVVSYVYQLFSTAFMFFKGGYVKLVATFMVKNIFFSLYMQLLHNGIAQIQTTA